MIGLPAGTRIWLAAGITDMRAGMNGLAARVESALTENPYSGHVFVFRGRRGDMTRDEQILGLEAQLNTRATEIEHLKLTIAKLRRMQFGRKSEKLDHQIEQLELQLEDLQADEAEAETASIWIARCSPAGRR